jgi:hypothetical protein
MDIPIPCLCRIEDKHAGDSVTLRTKLGLFEAASIRNAILIFKEADPKATAGDVLAVMTEANVLAGIESWTLRELDDKGKVVPITVTRQAIRDLVLSNIEVAMQIGDAAYELYEDVMLPLLRRAFKLSPDSPTTESTSPTNGSPPKSRKRSKRSSISTIPTAVTEATSKSLVGVSSSSQSSESAA